MWSVLKIVNIYRCRNWGGLIIVEGEGHLSPNIQGRSQGGGGGGGGGGSLGSEEPPRQRKVHQRVH